MPSPLQPAQVTDEAMGSPGPLLRRYGVNHMMDVPRLVLNDNRNHRLNDIRNGGEAVRAATRRHRPAGAPRRYTPVLACSVRGGSTRCSAFHA
jgi:hypothetical protein